MYVVYIRNGGEILIERHISDTRTMRWEIYYDVHPQSSRTLYAAPGVSRPTAGLQRRKSADKHT